MPIELGTNLKQNANAGAPMVLKGPATGAEIQDADGNKATLLLFGKDSDAYQRAERAFQKEMAALPRRAGKAADPKVFEDYVFERTVACTAGWQHCSYAGETTFSPDLIRKLYRNEPWVLEQAVGFIEDREHFIGASKTT